MKIESLMEYFKKLTFTTILAIILAATFLPLLSRPVKAANPWYHPSLGEYLIKVYDQDSDQIFGERYTHAQVVWIVHSLTAIMMSEDIKNCWSDADTGSGTPDPTAFGTCIDAAIGPTGSPTGYSQPPTYASVIKSYLHDNSLSGAGYFYRKMKNPNDLVPVAYAQQPGFGFGNLAPLQNIWVAIRNFAYFFLILLIIVFAFMIMFRTKTSPQTVITIQSAIPKLIITLIVITFSYAIAGLLVDLTFVVLGIFAVAAEPLTSLTSGIEVFINLVNPIAVVTAVWIVMLAGVYLTIAIGVGGIVAGFFSLIGFPAAVLGPLIVFVLLLIFIAIIAIRTAWTMLKAFIQIVLLIVFAPVVLLFSGLPGRAGVTSWMRDLAGNLVVFPMVAIMAFFSHYFSWSFLTGGGPVTDFFLSLSDTSMNTYQIEAGVAGGGIHLPLFAGETSWAGFAIALGFLFLIPHAANMVKSFIAGQPFGYGSAIGQSMGAFTSPGKGAATFGLARHLERRETLAGGYTWYTSAVRRLTGIKG